MAAKIAGCCEGLVSSIDEVPTISEIMHKAIMDQTFPGGTVAFGSCTVPCYYQAYGTYTFESSIGVTLESGWDMASLTKIMVTTPCVMVLYDRSLIALEQVACKYLPEFGNNGKEIITVRQLLTHTAGLHEFYPFFDMGLTKREEVLDYIMKDKVWYGGETAHYSDLSMIVLGLIVERITGMPLDVFASKEIFEPLGMRHTSYRPVDTIDFNPMIVPTEVDQMHRNRLLWGEVHDPTAFVLGGVAGHAGLFSTIMDVCRFAQMMLAGGMDQATNCRLFKETTVCLFTTPGLRTLTNPRPFALGWDVAVRRSVDGYTSAGKYLGPRTFGHTGFTGTSLWIDPDRNLFVALLTNAVHPTAVGGFGSQVRDVRPLIADAAVHAMGEQAIPCESLTWHLGFVYQGEEKRYLETLKEAHVLPTTDHDILPWEASLLGLQSSAMSENAQRTAGNVKSQTTLEVPSPVMSQQVAQVTFTSVTSSVVFGQNVSQGSPNKLVLWRRIVPIIILAVVIGVVS
ncbi:unnamed protein product [Sphagnum balticum]